MESHRDLTLFELAKVLPNSKESKSQVDPLGTKDLLKDFEKCYCMYSEY